MGALPGEQRRQLERAVVAARGAAEDAARAALKTLAVVEPAPFAAMDEGAKELRRGLRARARQLGGGALDVGLPLLVEEVAYEQWHRMLFARFLAENGLLREPGGVVVSLRDVAELADEAGLDAWDLAAEYAGAMLPGLFRADDPAVRVRFAREGRAKLEGILRDLPASTFVADDALGWVYQFWQKEKKDEVNKSGRKIGGADLSPVTQLFTEDYMVRFLLENSLGAWWAGKHPDSPLLAEFAYLRYGEDGAPAAGTFPGWPARAAEVTVMDPCCGSGHFLVAAFGMLRRMRAEEEGLGDAEAADATLRDNLFGLELDPRCAQIAAFAVAVAAWKVGGHPERFPPQVACSGVAVGADVEQWRRLARGDEDLRHTLQLLHGMFRQAPTLGSLIDPKRLVAAQGMFAPSWERTERALARLAPGDEENAVFAHAAKDTARAAELLGRTYTLVATNVPYLSRGSQHDDLKKHAVSYHDDAKADLATIFIDRCLSMCDPGGSLAVVSPQNWLFLGTYKHFRRRLLETATWEVLARLGPGAFETISGEVVNVALCTVTAAAPSLANSFAGVDVAEAKTPAAKDTGLREWPVVVVGQQGQLENPDWRIIVSGGHGRATSLLGSFARPLQGIGTADLNRHVIRFWEIPEWTATWERYQRAPEKSAAYSGCDSYLRWEKGKGTLARSRQARICGQPAWGTLGVGVGVTRNLYTSLYPGVMFDCTLAVIVPNDMKNIDAVTRFVQSAEFSTEVRKVDQALSVTESSFGKVPFDLDRWQKMAEEQYPDGLPEPHSNDPTQWLFGGHPVESEAPLQVAVARLLGYRWPQHEADALDGLADTDGVVCLPPVNGEQPAAERLRAFLVAAYGERWTPGTLDGLLAGVDYAGKDLATWLRDGFFAQHCRMFHNRPFVWHVWDGVKDGFSALVNYHALDAGKLEKLIYTYLGSWIAQQRAEMGAGVAGAEGRYLAAQKLQGKLIAIRQGEPPHDVYVRWKPLHEQPIGWEPDLNDGVRLNVRPFVRAEVLRGKFSVNWNKDRGTNPDGSERINDPDPSPTLDERRAARAAAGGDDR